MCYKGGVSQSSSRPATFCFRYSGVVVFWSMDNMGGWERKNLLNELMQGRELTKQLQVHFHHVSSSPSSSTSHEMLELLIFRILLSYDKALSMLGGNYVTGELTATGGGGGPRLSRKSESSPSLVEGPKSGDVDRENKEHEGNNNNNGDSRGNRKAMPRWTKRVRVIHGTLIERQIDDGLSWRKYGQKDILGAKFPRGYYRCTHKGSQGCLATKKVQQSDEDPTVFEITYCGRHTCSNPSARTNPPSSSPSPESQEQNHALVVAVPSSEQQQADHGRQKDHDDVLDFYKSLEMITDSSSKNQPPAFELSSISDHSHQFQPSLGTFDFPESLTGFDLFRENQNFRSLDHSELGLVVSAANRTATSSGTDSRAVNTRGNLDFAFGLPEFDNSFGNTEFFSK